MQRRCLQISARQVWQSIDLYSSYRKKQAEHSRLLFTAILIKQGEAEYSH